MAPGAVILLAAWIITACSVAGTPTGPQRNPPALLDTASCAAKGGAIRNVCLAQMPACVRPYRDGGQPCTDKSQCEGMCLHQPGSGLSGPRGGDTIVGTCQRDNNPCGCFATVEAGQLAGGLCVD